MCPTRISPGNAPPLPLSPTRYHRRDTPGRLDGWSTAEHQAPRVRRHQHQPCVGWRLRPGGYAGAATDRVLVRPLLNYLPDRSLSADMTTATAPRLAGEALAAVQHRGSHRQIIASAGSGKTELVAQRVADLIATGVDPAGIVAFMLTVPGRFNRRADGQIVHGACVGLYPLLKNSGSGL